MPRPERYLGSYGRNLCVTGEFTGAFSSRYRRACVRKHFPEYQEKMWSHNVGEPLVCCLLGSVAALQECFDKLGRYGPRTLSRRSVQMAPIRTGNDTTGSGLVLAFLTVVP